MMSYILKIKEAFCDLISDVVSCYHDAMDQMEAQNSLASVSGYDFVWVLHPVAKKISEKTGKRYCDILMEAKDKLLAGENETETLWYFDIQLIRN